MAIRNLTIILALVVLSLPAAADEWTDACRLIEDLGITCDRVAPPPVVKVRFTDQRRDRTVDAVVRFGGILVRDSLPEGVDRSSVIVHEMVHYILNETGRIRLGVDRDSTCQSEAVAFAVSNRYLAEMGRRDLQTRRWWRLYAGCTQAHSVVEGLLAES